MLQRKSPMRIVHLTTQFPWPATSGGPVRTLSQLRVMAALPEVEEIVLLSVVEDAAAASDASAFEALRAAVPKLRVVSPVLHPIHLWDFPRYVPRVLALRALGVPYLAAKWDSRALRATLRKVLAESRPDVVYIEHLGMAQYLRDAKATCPQARTVLDQHNVECDFFEQFAARQRGVKKIVATAEHRAARRYERDAMRGVDAVVAISGEDARRFATLAGVSAHVVPVVIHVEKKTRPAVDRAHFCYVGSLRWHPNVAGLDWLCREVWPKIRARLPDATLEIAGVGLAMEGGKALVPDAWKVAGVETVGFLEDLEPLFDRSIAMLAPMFGGSGVRMKVLEGFGAGVPIVTTSDGTSGLFVEDGRELLVGASADDFADRAVRVAEDGSLRARLAAAGYAYLEEHHSLPAAQSVMRAALGLPPRTAAASAAAALRGARTDLGDQACTR
jgi:glycosyltransferase involved in cell wall biosynthesis